MEELNMQSGKIGNKIKIDNKIITLQNSYELITDENGNKYYELEINKNNKLKINEDKLIKIINVQIDDIIYNSKWFIKDKKIFTNVNNKNINIVKYLFDKINDTKFRYTIRSDDEYDYRIENIKVYKPSDKNTEDRFKKMTSPPIFYKENEIKIIKNFEGHIIGNGPHSNKIYNNYRLVEIINETDESKKRYYEMFLGINNEDDEDNEENSTDTEHNETINTKFSFIFDEASLQKILKLKINKIVFNKPSWLMATNQYIWTRPGRNNLIYLHRYLMGCTIGDNTTVDHINGNILDNRLCNLRFATMSQQNMNRNNVSRKTTLNEILNPTNIPTIPKLSFDSLIFITLNTNDGLDHFSIEITKARTNIKDIREHSSKSKLLNIQEKLCHAICKRYFLIREYPQIINDKVDAKKFATIDAFKTYCGTLITSIMGSTYTIDTFLDHLNTKKIPKYRDQRKDFLDANTEQLVLANPNAIYTLDYKYSFLDKTNSITIPIDKIKPHDLRQSGIKNKNLSSEDKLCYSIMQRYYKLVEHENTCNVEIYKDPYADSTSNFTDLVNKNTTTYKTLTDMHIDDKQPFKSFDEFKAHTEMIINNIVTNHNFTLDTFAKYIIEKANHKKLLDNYPKLNIKYPILTRQLIS
jgi:hypothetical protein